MTNYGFLTIVFLTLIALCITVPLFLEAWKRMRQAEAEKAKN